MDWRGPQILHSLPTRDFLYVSVTANDSITWYQRDSLSGGLLFKGMIRDGVNGVDGLNGAYGLAVSPDGKHLFATGKDDHAVSWYILDSMNGTSLFRWHAERQPRWCGRSLQCPNAFHLSRR